MLSRVEFAPGKSGVWAIGILTIGFAVCRSFVVRQEHGFNAEKALSEVAVHTHYMPSHWVNAAHLKRTVRDLDRLFPNRFTVLITELLGLVLAPFILIFRMPSSARRIIIFFSNFTKRDTETGLNDVCSFAYFPLTTHGDPTFSPSPSPSPSLHSPSSSSSSLSSEDTNNHLSGAKLEQSLINFTEEYPSWRPPQEVNELVENFGKHSRNLEEGRGRVGGREGKREGRSGFGEEEEDGGGREGVFSSVIGEGGVNNRGYDLGVIQESFFRPQKESDF